MPNDSALTGEVIALFGEAALDPNAWLPALRALASATSSSQAQLIGIGGPATLQFNITDLSGDADADFLEIEAGSPEVSTRVRAGMTVGPMEVVNELDYDLARSRLRQTAYADFERKWDIPNGCQAVLEQGNDGLMAVAMLRSAKDGRTTPDDIATFRSALPFVRAAVRTQMTLGGQGARLMAGALEAVSVAAFVLSGSGRVQSMTPAAEALLADGAVRLLDGWLRLRDLRSDKQFQGALATALSADVFTALALPAIPVGGGASHRILRIDRVPRRAYGGPFAAALIVTAVDAPAPSKAQILRRSFGLTESETAITLALCDGKSRAAIAEDRQVSLGTVRQQIKTIYSKLGVSREAELILTVQRRSAAGE